MAHNTNKAEENNAVSQQTQDLSKGHIGGILLLFMDLIHCQPDKGNDGNDKEDDVHNPPLPNALPSQAATKGAEKDEIALTNCPAEIVLEYLSPETKLAIKGLRETCIKVLPIPRRMKDMTIKVSLPPLGTFGIP